MKGWQKFGIGVATITGMVAAGSWWAVQQTRHVPDFYRKATQQATGDNSFAERQMEVGIEQLRHDTARAGEWKATFSDAQVNAWLQNELPLKFPRLLARGASDPRIVIQDGRVLAAARYRGGRIDTVVSCELDVQLTEQPNMLALRVHHLRVGALPMPLGQFIRGISNEAAHGDVDIQWDKTADGPVALVTIPTDHPGYAQAPVVIESVHLGDGNLTLSGHSGELAGSIYHPHGPLHQFVSYRPDIQTDSPSPRLVR